LVEITWSPGLPKCTDLDQAVQNDRMAQGIINLRSFDMIRHVPNAGEAENKKDMTGLAGFLSGFLSVL